MTDRTSLPASVPVPSEAGDALSQLSTLYEQERQATAQQLADAVAAEREQTKLAIEERDAHKAKADNLQEALTKIKGQLEEAHERRRSTEAAAKQKQAAGSEAVRRGEAATAAAEAKLADARAELSDRRLVEAKSPGTDRRLHEDRRGLPRRGGTDSGCAQPGAQANDCCRSRPRDGGSADRTADQGKQRRARGRGWKRKARS